MQMALELGIKVPIVITGDPEPHETNAVFLLDAVRDSLHNIDDSLLGMLYRDVKREVLGRSFIINSQTKV